MHIWDTSMYRIAPGRVCNAILYFFDPDQKISSPEQPVAWLSVQNIFEPGHGVINPRR
jgi:hypothetical protein